MHVRSSSAETKPELLYFKAKIKIKKMELAEFEAKIAKLHDWTGISHI